MNRMMPFCNLLSDYPRSYKWFIFWPHFIWNKLNRLNAMTLDSGVLLCVCFDEKNWIVIFTIGPVEFGSRSENSRSRIILEVAQISEISWCVDYRPAWEWQIGLASCWSLRSLAIIHAETSEHLAASDCPALSVGINLPLQLAHFSATCLGRFAVHRLPVNYRKNALVGMAWTEARYAGLILSDFCCQNESNPPGYRYRNYCICIGVWW